MLGFGVEEKLFRQGFSSLAAIDEAGRGPLAGPVVAGCVLIEKDFDIKRDERFALINDSKKISEKKREELFDFVEENFKVGVGICSPETIDRINILQATFLAMKKAISDLRSGTPEYVILDGKFPIPNCSYNQKPIVGGDKSVFSIAVASIVAKVYRDRLMRVYDEQYPAYGFARHKGYGTKDHLEAIRKKGACPIHRKSFRPISNFKSP